MKLNHTPGAIPTAASVLATKPHAEVSVRAQEGFMKRGASSIAAYFKRNATEPFSEAGGWTQSIRIALVDGGLNKVMAKLGFPVAKAAREVGADPALTEPLRQLLESKGYEAYFMVKGHGFADDWRGDWYPGDWVTVTLKKKDATPTP